MNSVDSNMQDKSEMLDTGTILQVLVEQMLKELIEQGRSQYEKK